MAQVKAPNFKQEDYQKFLKDYPEMESFMAALNQFTTAVSSALSKGLTFGDNFLCHVREVTVAPGQTYPLTVSHDLKTKPQGVLVLQALDITTKDPLPTDGAVFVDWSVGDRVIAIRNVAGLAEGRRYTLRLLIIG